MKSSILVSKVHIPNSVSKCVIRKRLFDRLNQGLEKAMTLISAPSGYGKTTLMSNWLNEAKPTAAWLSLEDSENDLIRFLEYFIAAIRQVAPDFAHAIKMEIESPISSDPQSVINGLINELNDFPQNIALVLDNYHSIYSKDVHEFITHFIDHIPLQVHLYVITRTDPMFQFSKLRAGKQLIEISAQDLMFRKDEISQFFIKNLGITLSEQHMDVLNYRFEGWVAGLQMVSLSMKSYKTPDDLINMLSGSLNYIFDYLSEEVLLCQPDHIQDFLLKTSILHRLSIPLCKLLTGRDDTYDILKYLEDSNLFIFILDNEKKWYRYHRLFADFLLHRLKMINPQDVIDLNLKAVKWYLDQGMPEEALHYAYCSEDYNLVLDILESSTLDMLSAGRLTTVHQWFNKIPDSLIILNPAASIYKTWAMLCVETFQPDRYEFYLNNAEQKIMAVLDKASDIMDETIRLKNEHLLGKLYLIRGWIESSFGNYESASQLAQKSLVYLSDDDFFNRTIAMMFIAYYSFITEQPDKGFKEYSEALNYARQFNSQYFEYYVLFGLIQGKFEVGNLKNAEHIIDEAERRYYERFPDEPKLRPEFGLLLILRGELLYAKNQLDEAEQILIKALSLSKNSIISLFQMTAYADLALVMLAKGDEEKFRELIKRSKKYFLKIYFGRQFIHSLILSNTISNTFHNYLSRLVHKNKTFNPTLYNSFTIYKVQEQMLLAVGYIKEDKSIKAIQLLEELQSVLKVTQSKILYIKILILTALAYQQMGDLKIAKKTLAQAIELAEPIGCLRIFLNEGEPLIKLLTLVKKDIDKQSNVISSEFIDELLSSQPVGLSKDKKAISDLNELDDWSYHLDPLTDRELEVLKCISQGLTNKEIAEKLFISSHTVNNHSKNIHSKLNVNNRIKAVEKARRMGLL